MLPRKHNYTIYIIYCSYVNVNIQNISFVACVSNCLKCTVKDKCSTDQCKEGYVIENDVCASESFYGSVSKCY